MDSHSKEVRSYNMSQIRSTNSKPEMLVRKYLFAKGLRYRKNVKTLPGKPDIVLKKYKTVVFVNGCFWHKHEGCKYFVWPKNNEEFWKTKILGNVARDREKKKQLEFLGWRVFVVWECELKKSRFEETLAKLCCLIKSNTDLNPQNNAEGSSREQLSSG